jgi:hypothetical protein
MTSSTLSYRWIAIILLSLGLSNVSCKGPGRVSTVDVAEAPSNLYMISYAHFFVGALRSGGTAAGAFEISSHTETDDLYHFKIEFMEDDILNTLDLRYEGQYAGLKPVSSRVGDEELEKYSRLAIQLRACHKVAVLRAKAEESGEQDVKTTELLIDFSAGGPAGKVWRRYLRISDLAIRERFSELEVSENVPDNFDLGFDRDQFIGISSRRGRNLMRLGTGSEHHLLRFAQVVDWHRTSDLTRDFTALVKAVGITIDENSNAGYWSPFFNVPLRAGEVYAVRAVDGHSPSALFFVQESQRDMARLLVAHAPLGVDKGTTQD